MDKNMDFPIESSSLDAVLKQFEQAFPKFLNSLSASQKAQLQNIFIKALQNLPRK
jgi:archaellum biogenesis protein FlaJ (TadC family)